MGASSERTQREHVVNEKPLTSYHTIQHDLRNAGDHWLDRKVAFDRNKG